MTVRLSIDGKMIDAPEGAGLLDVARENGLTIPTLCYHRDLSPTGNCRICVVEIQGQRFLQAACVTNVWEGMIVQTHTERVVRSRRLTLELMLANHPQDCLVCDSSGSCELQDLAYDYHVECQHGGVRVQSIRLTVIPTHSSGWILINASCAGVVYKPVLRFRGGMCGEWHIVVLKKRSWQVQTRPCWRRVVRVVANARHTVRPVH